MSALVLLFVVTWILVRGLIMWGMFRAILWMIKTEDRHRRMALGSHS